jgi:hypothetical protein
VRGRWPRRALHLELDDGITDTDDAANEDVGIDAGPMGELLDDPRSRHLLQMATWFAKLDSEALHLADAEPFANETVDIHVAHSDLTSSLSRPETNLLDDLGCNERQRLAWRSSVGMEMTVPFDALPGDGPHGIDRPQRWLARSSEMNRLHRHGSIMHQPSVESMLRVIPELTVILGWRWRAACARDSPAAAERRLTSDTQSANLPRLANAWPQTPIGKTA